MPTTIDTQCQQVRSEIARSRRRLDRTVQHLASLPRRASWLPQLVAADNGRWVLAIAAISCAISQWPHVHRWLLNFRSGAARVGVSGSLDRWARQIRVLAWRHRRRQDSSRRGVPS